MRPMTHDALQSLARAISPGPEDRSEDRPRGGFRNLVDRLVAADRAWRDRRRFEDLPDHILKDIGVSRTDLYRSAGSFPW